MIDMLHFNIDYNNKIQQYKRKDGILATIMFFIVIMLYLLLALIETKFKFIHNNILVYGCIFNIILVLITILFIKLSGEKLDTVGLYNGKWKTSFIIGIILAIIFLFNNCISHLLFNGSKLISIKSIIELAVYYFCVSFSEEIVFRGYIGTRLFGLIKRKWLTIIITGLFFVVMHFPYRMIAYDMSLTNLLFFRFDWILDLFFTHILFTVIYMKTNSIYGSIIPHWISNLAFSIIEK